MKRTDQKRATGNRSLWAMAIALLFSLAVLSCSKTETGTITNVYQPLVSGMVNTYISVLFDDGQSPEVNTTAFPARSASPPICCAIANEATAHGAAKAGK